MSSSDCRLLEVRTWCKEPGEETRPTGLDYKEGDKESLWFADIMRAIN